MNFILIRWCYCFNKKTSAKVINSKQQPNIRVLAFLVSSFTYRRKCAESLLKQVKPLEESKVTHSSRWLPPYITSVTSHHRTDEQDLDSPEIKEDWPCQVIVQTRFNQYPIIQQSPSNQQVYNQCQQCRCSRGPPIVAERWLPVQQPPILPAELISAHVFLYHLIMKAFVYFLWSLESSHPSFYFRWLVFLLEFYNV